MMKKNKNVLRAVSALELCVILVWMDTLTPILTPMKNPFVKNARKAAPLVLLDWMANQLVKDVLRAGNSIKLKAGASNVLLNVMAAQMLQTIVINAGSPSSRCKTQLIPTR